MPDLTTDQIEKVAYSFLIRACTLIITAYFVTILTMHEVSAKDKTISAVCAVLSSASTILLWAKSRFAFYVGACFLAVLAAGSVLVNNPRTQTAINQLFRYGLCLSLLWLAFRLFRFGSQLAKS